MVRPGRWMPKARPSLACMRRGRSREGEWAGGGREGRGGKEGIGEERGGKEGGSL